MILEIKDMIDGQLYFVKLNDPDESEWIFKYKEGTDELTRNQGCICIAPEEDQWYNDTSGFVCENEEIEELRLATPEERRKYYKVFPTNHMAFKEEFKVLLKKYDGSIFHGEYGGCYIDFADGTDINLKDVE